MSSFNESDRLGTAICKALGVDEKTVTDIVIRLRIDAEPEVYIGGIQVPMRFDALLNGIPRWFAAYRLVPA